MTSNKYKQKIKVTKKVRGVEKDETISRLKAKIAEMETNSNQEKMETKSNGEAMIAAPYETISRLKVKIAEMEANSIKKDDEISKLSRVITMLQKSQTNFSKMLGTHVFDLRKFSNNTYYKLSFY